MNSTAEHELRCTDGGAEPPECEHLCASSPNRHHKQILKKLNPPKFSHRLSQSKPKIDEPKPVLELKPKPEPEEEEENEDQDDELEPDPEYEPTPGSFKVSTSEKPEPTLPLTTASPTTAAATSLAPQLASGTIQDIPEIQVGEQPVKQTGCREGEQDCQTACQQQSTACQPQVTNCQQQMTSCQTQCQQQPPCVPIIPHQNQSDMMVKSKGIIYN